MSGKVRVGTSGWHYEHWRGPFYPEGTSGDAELPFYSARFPTVEVNNSFYRLPEEDVLRGWRESTPDGFTFAVKASRYITHMKKLTDAGDAVATFLSRMGILGDKLGPILFQLPPNWHANRDRLRSFLQGLPDGHRYAFEFRDPTWFAEPITDLLREERVAFCIHDMRGEPSPKVVTAPFVYIRFHGPNDAYQGSYSAQDLAGWAGAISTWRRQGREVFCYFNNDAAGHATRNAATLQAMVADPPGSAMTD